MVKKFEVRGQQLIDRTRQKLVEKSSNFVECEFEFDNSWKTLTSVALFLPDGETEPIPVIIKNNKCYVPNKLSYYGGFCKLAVIGGDGAFSDSILNGEAVNLDSIIASTNTVILMIDKTLDYSSVVADDELNSNMFTILKQIRESETNTQNYANTVKNYANSITTFEVTSDNGHVEKITTDTGFKLKFTFPQPDLAGYVKDENYVHTDNNYTAEDKAAVSEALDTACEALAAAGNPLQPVYFSSCSLLCHYANVGKLDSMRTAGQPVFIKQTDCPDLWISAINEEFTPYEYASDEEFIDVLKSQGFITVGYYEFRPIEVTEKADLTDYSTTEEINKALSEYATKSEVATVNSRVDEVDVMVDVVNENTQVALNIAQGANQAVCFNNYEEMITFFNVNPNWENDTYLLPYLVGQNIMIGTVDVPDLWIASETNVEEYIEYVYKNDEAFVSDLNTALENGEFLRVGYITLGALETQKVDLTAYSTTEEMNAAIAAAVGDVLGGAS